MSSRSTPPANGYQGLKRHYQSARPGLKVLYTSGYTGKKTGLTNDIDITPTPMLGKPYKRVDLARAVAHALGRADEPRTA